MKIIDWILSLCIICIIYLPVWFLVENFTALKTQPFSYLFVTTIFGLGYIGFIKLAIRFTQLSKSTEKTK